MNGWVLVAALLSWTGPVFPQTVDLAKAFHRHGLSDRAKETLVLVLHDPKSTATSRAQALYWLGQISFEEKRYAVALEDWDELAKGYPESPEAKQIVERLAQLRDVAGEVLDRRVDSAVARSYLGNGDFWSDARSVFSVDASWLPKVLMANWWYDRVIQEFPGTPDAELAYTRKLFALLGWKEPGQYGESYGVMKDFLVYMSDVLTTFSAFEQAFPGSSYLQGFRFQIAQAYWRHKNWSETRAWLQKIIDAAKGKDTFYSELAKARLQKLEY